jgi:tetratricopeptide (TPR) repeat protein
MKSRSQIFRPFGGCTAALVLACSLNLQAQANIPKVGDETASRVEQSVRSTLPAVPSPDLNAMDAPVQQQIRNAQLRLTEQEMNDQQLGEAYGRLGEIYQAYGLNDAAIACYSDAHILESGEFKWPYYLGYVLQTSGDLRQALSNYRIALQLRAGDEITIHRLANANLSLDQLDEAEKLYQQELSQDAKSVAAMDGLGRVALAHRQFAKAIEYLNVALAIDPQAAYLHYPLGMAYRGLGNMEKAQDELNKHGPAAPELTDHYLEEVQEIKTGKADLWAKASQQMAANNLPEAIASYRKLVESNGQDAVARTYLGTALARAGNTQAAIQQFTEALRIAPNNAETHYCLGVVLATMGNDEQAIEHFRATIHGDPQFPEVHFQFANVLMRTRRYDEAAAEYKRAMESDSHNTFASVMRAMALVRLGHYKDARSVLEQAHSAAPSDFDIDNALARLLAAAPDDSARDGQRALGLMQEIIKSKELLDSDQAETVAMALAETGQFEKAANIQRSVIETVEQESPGPQVDLLRETLAHYEHGEACRTPWRDDDPIFFPTPQKGADPQTSQARSWKARERIVRTDIFPIEQNRIISVHSIWIPSLRFTRGGQC